MKRMTISRLRPLVSTNWLSSRLANITDHRQLRVLDTSFNIDPTVDSYQEAYLQKHIPGSKYFNLHKCVESTQYIPRNLPDASCFTRYVRSLGVWSDTHVVTYDRTNSYGSSCRVWWLFRLFGHENISVLDGGLGKWVADGHDTSTLDPEYELSDFSPKMKWQLLRDFDAMVKNLESGEEQVMDARRKQSFCGKPQEPHSGHIPGSKNLPFSSLFNEDGTFRNQEELQTLFEAAGIDLQKPVISTCGTGITACALALTAAILGKPDVPIYYGSWREWRQRSKEELCIKGDN